MIVGGLLWIMWRRSGWCFGVGWGGGSMGTRGLPCLKSPFAAVNYFPFDSLTSRWRRVREFMPVHRGGLRGGSEGPWERPVQNQLSLATVRPAGMHQRQRENSTAPIFQWYFTRFLFFRQSSSNIWLLPSDFILPCNPPGVWLSVLWNSCSLPLYTFFIFLQRRHLPLFNFTSLSVPAIYSQ